MVVCPAGTSEPSRVTVSPASQVPDKFVAAVVLPNIVFEEGALIVRAGARLSFTKERLVTVIFPVASMVEKERGAGP